MKTVSGDTKPLNKLSVTVPLGGAVKNALSKPNGNWNPEQSKMVWEIATVPPTQGQGTFSDHDCVCLVYMYCGCEGGG